MKGVVSGQKSSHGGQQQKGWRSHENATHRPINADCLHERLEEEKKKSKAEKKLETTMKRDRAPAGMDEADRGLA